MLQQVTAQVACRTEKDAAGWETVCARSAELLHQQSCLPAASEYGFGMCAMVVRVDTAATVKKKFQ